MKKLILKSLLAIACLLCSISIYAQEFEVDGIYYNKLSATEVEVAPDYINFCSYIGDVIIPETVEIEGITYNVTSIGRDAFTCCTGLTSVTIPNSVTSIGDYAFIGCINLTKATIGKSVTEIGSHAFDGCDALTEVTIPNSVTSIGDYAFYACINLTKATIGKSVTSIGEKAFSNCNGLTQIYCQATTPPVISSNTFSDYRATLYVPIENMDAYRSADYWKKFTKINRNLFVDGLYYNILLPTDVEVTYKDTNYNSYAGEIIIPETVEIEGITFNVTSIGSDAFSGCTGLTSVTIGNSVTSIGSRAFKDCTGLTEVTIPNSVTSIGEEAFEGCTGLTEITIPNSVTSIGRNTFVYCTGLTSVTIPNSVTSIGDYAFSGCTGLKEVTIPNSVTEIGYSAFSGCTGLTTVNFNAENCTTMGSSSDPVFNGCTNLSTINIGENVKTILRYAFSRCTGLKEVTIPNSVTSIDDYAFYDCTGLTVVTIGNSVSSIGDYAFDKCDRIKEVYTHPTVPPVIGSHTFTVYVNDNATLYLYKESQEAYAEADYWEYFVKIGTIKKEYTLTYMVDDTLYAQEYYFEGDTITPIAEPEKENYIFSGWSEIPEIMPSHDVTVTGSFMEVVFDSVINDTVSSFIVNKEMYCDELIYIRDFDNTDWQAWYVPFEVDYTTIAYDFEVACINNVHQYDQNNDGEMDLTELEAVKMQEGVLKANYPYIVKAHSTGVKQVILNNSTLQPTEVCSIDCSSVSLCYTFTGTYNAMTGSELMQNGCYALQYNMLEAPTEESALGAFRWYMQIEQRSGDNNAVPQCIVLKVKEDFTDIENVMNNTDNAPVEYYDLSGRRVVEPTSGIYIVKQGNTVRKVVINK